MEKEGLKRSLSLLRARDVTIDCIVTDRHPQIQKFLREESVTQFYDVWHMEKGTFPFVASEDKLHKYLLNVLVAFFMYRKHLVDLYLL